MPRLHVLRVFTATDGSGGNPLGVFLDGGAIAPAERQRVAADLAFSETVFVDDRARGTARIFAPGTEVGFAGHPSVGTAWLLRQDGAPVDRLRVPAGEVGVRYGGDEVFITARPEWSPPFVHHQLSSPAEVDALTGPPNGDRMGAAWAWEDESLGVVRSRVFALDLGIGEDEATGAAAMMLAARLGRPIEIHQGRGSLILARPLGDGRVEIGGSVALQELRDYEPAGSGGGTSSQ